METNSAIATVHAAICQDLCQGACRTAVEALNKQLPDFVDGHKLAKMNRVDDVLISRDEYDPEASKHQIVATREEAEVITSDTGDTTAFPGWAWGSPSGEEPLHRPVLDIDFPAALIPSTTPGHFHLYLDKPLGWTKYVELLSALANAEIIEQGYVGASVDRGYTAVRLPWVKKRPVEIYQEQTDWAA